MLSFASIYLVPGSYGNWLAAVISGFGTSLISEYELICHVDVRCIEPVRSVGDVMRILSFHAECEYWCVFFYDTM